MSNERIDILEIPLNNIKNEELLERATRSNGGRSTEYIVLLNNVEVALLSYEDCSDRNEGFIYEIFVLDEYRKKGLGSKLLKFAERKAILLNCKKNYLEPYSLDKNITHEFLMHWYEKHGYRKCCIDENKMVKFI